jgi:hypothetical protein
MEQIFTLGLGDGDSMPGDPHGEVWAAQNLSRIASQMGDPDMSYIWREYHSQMMPHQSRVQHERAAPLVRNPERILHHPSAEELHEK